ncbi:binding-protein-dependent transport systems inner membrane component [Paenibacillus vortex V453]|uniref:Binding-protein-dependent transport systems inner membrane component n=1 Tax=Paenibacillus vortex V453 TaxID=715225 RepID=A0A2R9SPN0_9BACL|nr:binding-protein-dependent transport systems inner membrane component [Paenibacillus vortex V453]OMF71394.1 polysaccharide ABC transporter ATP-binding protein [Paenibacillus glucanolyticus]
MIMQEVVVTLSQSNTEQVILASGSERERGGKKRSRLERMKVIIAREKYLYVLALPGLLFFLIFKYFPIWGLALAFQNYSPYLGFWGSEWVGLKYFYDFFTNPDFLLLFRNTMAISLLNIMFFFPVPIVLSLLINEVRSMKFKKTIQTIIYLPHFLSWVIIAGICFIILGQSDGIINKIIVELGGQPIGFLTEPNYFWGLLTAQSIWKEAGWGTIIFLAALAGINQDLYEAAQIDGANRWKQMLNVTLPGIKSTIIVLLILRLGQVMEVGFEQVYLMMSSPVSHVADVFDTYVYRTGIQNGRFSYATVVGIFKSVVGLLLVVMANRLAKKFGEEGLY